MKPFNEKVFLLDLLNTPWETLKDGSANEKAKIFDEIFESTFNRHAPLKRVKVHPNFKHGLSENTKKMIRRRDQTRQKASNLSGDERNVCLQKYKTLRNRIISQIRRESKAATIERINQSGKPSELWKTVKEVPAQQSHQTITLVEKQQNIRDKEKVAKIFNHFF